MAREILDKARDAITVKRVFGDPIERGGVTVIPVATVGGGGGGGGSPDSQGAESWGGGFGVSARPAGVYVIKDGEVRWQPSFNLNRAIMGGQLVAIVLALVISGIIRRLRR
jgi:uncharacterized spore protein YtfJ